MKRRSIGGRWRCPPIWPTCSGSSSISCRRHPRPPTRCVTLAGSPTIASKRWVYTAVRPHGADQHHQPAWSRRRRRPDQGHRRARWRCRSTATAATATSIRGAARCWRWPKRLATSPAPGRGRSARPTASTSATPNGRRSCGNSRRPSKESVRPAAPWPSRSPAETSASTTKPTARRSIRRRSSAWSACSSMPIAC